MKKKHDQFLHDMLVFPRCDSCFALECLSPSLTLRRSVLHSCLRRAMRRKEVSPHCTQQHVGSSSALHTLRGTRVWFAFPPTVLGYCSVITVVVHPKCHNTQFINHVALLKIWYWNLKELIQIDKLQTQLICLFFLLASFWLKVQQ